MKLPTELHRKPLSSGLFIPPQKTAREGIILLWIFTGEGAGAPSPVNIQKEDGPWLMVFQWGT